MGKLIKYISEKSQEEEIDQYLKEYKINNDFNNNLIE